MLKYKTFYRLEHLGENILGYWDARKPFQTPLSQKTRVSKRFNNSNNALQWPTWDNSSLLFQVMYSIAQCCTLLYSIVLYCTVLYNVIFYSTIHYSTILYSTLQYFKVPYFTVQYTPIQYNTVLHYIAVAYQGEVLLAIPSRGEIAKTALQERRTLQYRSVLYTTVLYSTLLNTTVLYSTVHYIAVKYCVI